MAKKTEARIREKIRPTLLTTTEVAKLLQCHDRSVINYANQQLIPHTRTPGGHRRFKVGAVYQFMVSQGLPIPHWLWDAITDDGSEP